MVRAARAILCAAGVALFFCASPSFGADGPPASPSQGTLDTAQERRGSTPVGRGGRRAGEARLDTVKIVGATEHPPILYSLPRTKFRLLPLRPEPDPATRILRDDKHSAEPPGW